MMLPGHTHTNYKEEDPHAPAKSEATPSTAGSTKGDAGNTLDETGSARDRGDTESAKDAKSRKASIAQ